MFVPPDQPRSFVLIRTASPLAMLKVGMKVIPATRRVLERVAVLAILAAALQTIAVRLLNELIESKRIAENRKLP